MKIEKIYQISVTDENEEIDLSIIDPVLYNVYYESSINDDYDKNHDDYQNYVNKISDNTVGKIDVNFINPSIPLIKIKPRYTCDRYQKSFDSRNRFFAHLRLDCWNNNIKPGEEFTVMITDTKPLPVITFSATAVENTGYVFRNWHYAVLQIHWKIDCFEPINICANNNCTMFIINRVYFQILPV